MQTTRQMPVAKPLPADHNVRHCGGMDGEKMI